MPSKGYDSFKVPVVLSKIEVNTNGRFSGGGLDLVRVNTEWCKLWVHERIRWPQDQPGVFFLPEDVSDDYCVQLISEARIRKPSGRAIWLQRSRENHYLDCEALAYAAGYLLNVQRISAARTDVEDAASESAEKGPVRRFTRQMPKASSSRYLQQ